MLSSIHPLGERGRHNRWSITVAAFTGAAMASGAAVGATLGYLGGALPVATSHDSALVLIGLAAAAAAVLDISQTTPPGSKRQVNEHWIGHYRGWVYGGAFGAQLGAGFATYVVTWTVPATFAAELFSGSWLGGAVIGAVFGLGRSIFVLAAGMVKRPSDLTSFHRQMARLGSPVRRLGAYSVALSGVVAIFGGLS